MASRKGVQHPVSCVCQVEPDRPIRIYRRKRGLALRSVLKPQFRAGPVQICSKQFPKDSASRYKSLSVGCEMKLSRPLPLVAGQDGIHPAKELRSTFERSTPNMNFILESLCFFGCVDQTAGGDAEGAPEFFASEVARSEGHKRTTVPSTQGLIARPSRKKGLRFSIRQLTPLLMRRSKRHEQRATITYWSKSRRENCASHGPHATVYL